MSISLGVLAGSISNVILVGAPGSLHVISFPLNVQLIPLTSSAVAFLPSAARATTFHSPSSALTSLSAGFSFAAGGGGSSGATGAEATGAGDSGRASTHAPATNPANTTRPNPTIVRSTSISFTTTPARAATHGPTADG